MIPVDGRLQPALLFVPDSQALDRPGWILLHGMTVPGRHHAGVFRFGRALAAAGAVAICPEIPDWTSLRVDPRPVHPTLVAAAEALGRRPDVDGSRIGTMAFSIAVPATLSAAARAPLPEFVSAVIGFGTSCDMGRTVACMLTGRHEWERQAYQLMPDPYGRWIVGSNALSDLSDEWGAREEREAVAAGLHRLAFTAGRNGAYSDAPVYDSLKVQLCERLSGGARRLWELLAPPAGRLPDDLAEAAELAKALAAAAIGRYPDLDARPSLSDVRARVHLVHGYADQLVPFTETLRLATAFPGGRPARVTITRLFGHARREVQGTGPHLGALAYPIEAWRFLTALREIVTSL